MDDVAQHPEGRPDSLSGRHLDARFESSIRLRELALGIETRGSVVAPDSVRSGVGLFHGLDHEPSVLQVGIASAGGVILQFLVTPPMTSSCMIPLLGINRNTIRSV